MKLTYTSLLFLLQRALQQAVADALVEASVTNMAQVRPVGAAHKTAGAS